MIMSVDGDGDFGRTDDQSSDDFDVENGGKIVAYLIFVIFFTLAKFLENRIYTKKRQLFALNL